jgi:nitrite reductase (cytochrome c-552)
MRSFVCGRVLSIRDRHHALIPRVAKATADMPDAIVTAKKAGGPDFVAAERSMGFHAPQEMARILSETIDYARG